MNQTAEEKRSKLWSIAESDPEYQKMKADYLQFEGDFSAYVDALPKEFRNYLWGYPGMAQFMFHRILSIACSMMDFNDAPPPPPRGRDPLPQMQLCVIEFSD